MAVSMHVREQAAASVARGDADRLVNDAHARAVSASAAEMAAYLQDLFGQNLTALITGIDHPKTVGRWARGQKPHPANLTRIRNAFHIATLLELATSRQTVQSWFMGMNPHLDDRAPALVLADEPDAAPRVMQAAHAFLAHG
jgi:hypothetical protein